MSLSLDYFVIDSWDIDRAEYALVLIDGEEAYRALFDDSYRRTELCAGGWPDVGPQRVVIQRPHTGARVKVRVSSTLDQDAWDESYGVDNIMLRIR